MTLKTSPHPRYFFPLLQVHVFFGPAQAWDLPKAKYPMNGGFHGGFPMAFKLISGKSLLVVRIPGFALDIRWR